MEFKDIVSISGLGGLFEMLSQRPNGMIVKPLGEEKTKFIAARKHTFTSLENIAVYTKDGSIELKVAFQTMQKEEGKTPVPEVAGSSEDTLRGYFAKVLPDYDKEKVYTNDIKKILRWYHTLRSMDLLPPETEEETSEKEEAKDVKEEPKTAKSTTKKAKAADADKDKDQDKPAKKTKAKKAVTPTSETESASPAKEEATAKTKKPKAKTKKA